jgi:hypothetical protein
MKNMAINKSDKNRLRKNKFEEKNTKMNECRKENKSMEIL